MTIIKDFHTSNPRKAGKNHTWAWEVVVQEYSDIRDAYYDDVKARFFDPWKAIDYGIKHYKGMCTVQAVLLHMKYLEGERKENLK